MRTVPYVSIIGASGYTGQETLDRVLAHPQLELYAVGSDSLAGRDATALDPRLNRNGGRRVPRFITNGAALASPADLVFLCQPHDAAAAIARTAVTARPGGIDGDRYQEGTGTFSTNPHRVGQDITLIEAEALDELKAIGISIAPEEARRNVVTRGIDLDALIGKHFRIGDIRCFGQRRAEPCAHLERLTPGTLRGLVHRGGIRADILDAGTISVGDEIHEE